jgi:hypothetical protein
MDNAIDILPPHLLAFFYPENHISLSKSSLDLQAASLELMLLLHGLIRKAAIQGYSKPWLVDSLKTLLGAYAHLRGTMQEVAVLMYIARTVTRNCPYWIDQDELRTLWR